MRCAGEHLVSGAHIVQRQEGAYLRGELSTVKQPRNAVQPFRSHLSVEEYQARVGSLRYRVSGHDRNKNSIGFQDAVSAFPHFSSNCVKYEINRTHGILEFARLIIHDRLATKSFDVLDVLRADDANDLQACVHRELNCIRTDISSGSRIITV